MKERINDSVRNCVTSIRRVEPATFLMPTSFALREACAVDRFMKLMAAISTIRMAILPKIIRYFGSLALFEILLNTRIKVYVRKFLQEKPVSVTLFKELIN